MIDGNIGTAVFTDTRLIFDAADDGAAARRAETAYIQTVD